MVMMQKCLIGYLIYWLKLTDMNLLRQSNSKLPIFRSGISRQGEYRKKSHRVSLAAISPFQQPPFK